MMVNKSLVTSSSGDKLSALDHYYFTVVTGAKILKPFIPKPHQAIFVRDNDLTYPVVLYFNHQIIEILPLII